MRALWIAGAALLVAVTITACSPAQEPAPSAERYDRFLSELHARGQFNGNALVVEAGEVVYRGSFGVGNIETDAPLNNDSVFRLGSVSKQFTAMGAMILEEQGKLDYDQDMRDFIPELPYEGITVRNLLNHLSGLPDYERLMTETWKPELDIADPARYISGNQDIIDVLAQHAPDVHFAPGEKWEYSNTGYVLLATVISRASGMPFETFLEENIFEPAGMSDTVVYHYVPGPDEGMPERAFGFRTSLDGNTRAPNDSHFLNFAQGDGGIYSTLDDLARWDRTLYTDKLVARDTLEEAFTPVVLNDGETHDYGFGWSIGETPEGKKVVSHGGGWVGFRTFIHREIEDDRCFVLLTNHSSNYLGGLVGGFTALLHGSSPEIPKLSLAEHLGKVVLNDGIEQARAEYARLKRNGQDEYAINEGELNNLGYFLLWEDRVDEAVGIFRLNTEEYPDSANVYDSLGEALLAQGDRAGSLANYKKALSMDPDMESARAKVAELTEE